MIYTSINSTLMSFFKFRLAGAVDEIVITLSLVESNGSKDCFGGEIMGRRGACDGEGGQSIGNEGKFHGIAGYVDIRFAFYERTRLLQVNSGCA
jgi:hypothetical protein